MLGSQCKDAGTAHRSHLLHQEEEAFQQDKEAGHQDDSLRMQSLYVRTEHLLGEGTYGKVYKATNKRTGRVVAMKKMPMDTDEEGLPSTFLREIALLKVLQHKHVVELLDIFVLSRGANHNCKIVLIFEFLDSDLKKFMRSNGNRLSSDLIRKLAQQTCSGVEFCHARGVLHRDLKPQNLLVDKEQNLKLADFGLAREYHPTAKKYTQEVVTAWYRAPELLLGSGLYSAPVDIWSMGCIIAEMAVGRPLFNGDSEIDTIFRIFRLLGSPDEDRWPGVFKLPNMRKTFGRWPPTSWAAIFPRALEVLEEPGIKLVDELLAYDPSRRLPARGALHHPFFNPAKPRPTTTSEAPSSQNTPQRKEECGKQDHQTPEKLLAEAPAASASAAVASSTGPGRPEQSAETAAMEMAAPAQMVTCPDAEAAKVSEAVPARPTKRLRAKTSAALLE